MTRRRLRIGLDVHGVATADKGFFSELTRLLVENGHEVHILTGAERTPELERRLEEDLGLSWTHIFSITTHCRESGADVEMIRGNPYVDEETWNRAKAAYCRRFGIDLHLDDSGVYGRHFHTPYARYCTCRRPAKKQQIAVLGGSFNPVTRAHLMMADAVLRSLPWIDQVWLMPAFRHPFEKHRGYSSFRIRMLRLVETDRIRYFGYEIDHRLSGETYITFSRLLDDPEFRHRCDFHMVVGGDCVLDFDTKWQHAEALANLVPFIIVPRPGYDLNGYRGLLSRPPHIILPDPGIPDISATTVRERLAAGRSIRDLVPQAVASFIEKHQLYQENGGRNMDTNGTDTPREAGIPAEASHAPIPCSHPSVFVNTAVCTLRDGTLQVLLTRSEVSGEPGSWAIPGGGLEMTGGEDLLEIAARRLAAKIGLEDIYIEQLKTYGSAGAFRTACRITVAYFALVPWERLSEAVSSGADGAAEAAWIPLKDYPAALADRGMSLAPDQDRILKDLMTRIQGKISYTPIAFELVPLRFTWPELRRVYEIVLGKRLDAANFKRKIRSMYRIRELKVRGRAATVGRPPKRLRFEGVKELYI